MALQTEKRRRMAMAIIRLVHECDVGMRIGVKYYREAAARGNQAEALTLLKRAARLPYRVEARVQAIVTKYTAATVNAALGQVSTLTLSDLAAELAPLKTFSDQLKADYLAGATQEEIAATIEAAAAQIDQDEEAPIPQTYVDDM